MELDPLPDGVGRRGQHKMKQPSPGPPGKALRSESACNEECHRQDQSDSIDAIIRLEDPDRRLNLSRKRWDCIDEREQPLA